MRCTRSKLFESNKYQLFPSGVHHRTRQEGRHEVARTNTGHVRINNKGRTESVLPLLLERKTDFRPGHIPCLQSAHYMKYLPRRSLPRCGHHALVCIPMLSTKIRNLQSKYKLKIRFCAATAPAVRASPNGSIRRVVRTMVPLHAGSCRRSVCGRCSRSARR